VHRNRRFRLELCERVIRCGGASVGFQNWKRHSVNRRKEIRPVQKAFLAPLLRQPSGSMILVNTRSGRCLAHSLIGAFDSASRRTGLLGRDGLDQGHALIIAPTSGIHTFFMRFAIDVAFVRRDGRVVSIRHAMKPWRIAIALGAHAAVELPAGTLAGSDTVRGDALVITAAH
jgi:uncharacterized membrane protein (UPF0127 family)